MVDMAKMRRGYQREQRGGEYYNFDVGETLLYIHQQCRPTDKWEPTDGVNYVPVVVHFGVGKKGKSKGTMVASLDPEINPIIEHPFVKRLLKKRKVKLTGKCPMKKLLESNELDGDEANDMRANTRYLWGVTPLAHRADSSEDWRKLVPKPSVLMAGKTVYDGVMETFFDNGDISEPLSAILVIVKREGKDMTTKYTVRADPDSLKKPKKLSKELRAQLTKALKEEGDCDLFKVVSNMIKSPAEVEALISGVKTESDPEEWDDDDEDGEKDLSESFEDDDDSSETDDDDEKDLDDDEPPEDDDDEPPDDDDDESSDDEPPDDDDDESSDDDSDPDLDDDDDEPPPKPKKDKPKKDKPKKDKPKKDKPKKTSTDDDDEDDLGLAEIDEELERISKKDESSKDKSKKDKSKPKKDKVKSGKGKK